MNTMVFSDAMGMLGDRYVEEAAAFQRRRKPMVWKAVCAAAACVVLAAVLILPLKGQKKKTISAELSTPAETDLVTDNEPFEPMTVEEILQDPAYGRLFPRQLLEGYVPSGDTGVYGNGDNTVLVAAYEYPAFYDEMVIRIATEDWFHKHEPDSFCLNVVQYHPTSNYDDSYIYLKCGEYLISYSFSRRDIAKIIGFAEMANSAEGINWEP